MKFKNNWDALLPSRQQVTARRFAEKQKRLTAEELFEEGEKAHNEMLKRKAFETKKKTTLN